MASQTISVVKTIPLFQMSDCAKGANNKYRRILIIVLGSVVSVATAQTTPVVPHPPNAVSQTGWATYRGIDLGPVVPSPPGQPNSIANTSVVAGAAPMLDGTVRAVLWFAGSLMDLGANRLRGGFVWTMGSDTLTPLALVLSERARRLLLRQFGIRKQ